MKPYQRSIEWILSHFETDKNRGLSTKEVTVRLQRDGYNVLPEPKQKTIFSIFIDQFKNPLIYILLVAAVIIFIVGENKLDAFIISGVLFFNAILGTVQEGRTYNIIASLKRMIRTDCVVLRDGKKVVVPHEDLVVGDIVLLQEGQRIPADLRIFESNNLQVDEAVLTGESVPVTKTTDVITKDVPIGDRKNMLFKGTYVLIGSGKGIVIATGKNTEIGKIHRTVEEIKTDIPLKKELERLSYWILIFILIFCIFLFVFGLLTGKPFRELLVMLTALFICVIPEGLPVVLTLVLVTGVLRMARQHVLIKNMQAVEALGRTDVIITDKTGTLTRNEMIVSRVFTDNRVFSVSGQGYHSQGEITSEGKRIESFSADDLLMQIGIASSLLNTSEITYLDKLDLFDIKGDPTEAAMYVFSKKLGLSKKQLSHAYTKLYEIPFNPAYRYHAGFYKKNGRCIAYISGSPEVLCGCSEFVDETIQKEFTRLLDEGLRVVAVGKKEIPCAQLDEDALEKKDISYFKGLVSSNITLLGLCGIEDSIRPEVASIVHQARDAGLEVIMATGDHKKTAMYVAKQVGIYQEGDEVVDGSEFETLSDQALMDHLDKITVYSRVAPEYKMKIVRLFHQKHKIVAMTGDGINDAPSLVAADLGIAMGNIGTEVAKQASDMVLLTDSFVNIIRAIEQGRYIFYTLKRIVLYFFATNLGEILIILFVFILSFVNKNDIPLPITAAQILWLNLVTDGFLDVGLSMEPQEPGLLSKRWLEHKPKLIDWALLLKTIYMAIPMGIGSLWLFLQYYQTDIVHARTMTLITMAMFQWFNAWNCRSTTRSLFQIGLFSNRWLIVATSFVLFLQIMVLHVPVMQHIFKTVSLSLQDWCVIILISSPILVIEELRKFFVRRLYHLN